MPGGISPALGAQQQIIMPPLMRQLDLQLPGIQNPKYFGNPLFALSVKSPGLFMPGGNSTNIGGQPRNNIAALDATTGLATSWNPNASHVVRALVISGGIVYVGGGFITIGGQTRIFIAALDATTGLATDFWDPVARWGGYMPLAESNGIVYAGGDFSRASGE